MLEQTTPSLRILLEVATATGAARAVNEDGVVLDAATGSCAVIDGGGARGDLATALIQRELPGVLAERLVAAGTSPEGALVGALEVLNARLVQANRGDPQLAGSGAAVTALLVHDDHAHIAHCGDARAYLLRDNALVQLTTDHTMVAELVARGEIEPHEAEHHPYANIVTQVLGFSEQIEVQSCEQPLRPGDLVLLCTDGLWRAIPARDLEDIALGPADTLHLTLIDRALDHGTDNVAVVVARVLAP
jgi:serine/threonine protein phosphatase PrpC